MSFHFTQIGSDIDGEAFYDISGDSVSLSADGTVVAIGASGNDGNGISSGHVRIYKNINNNWVKIGSDIDGEAAYDQSGSSVSLSADGSIVAIGAIGNDGNGSGSGHVRIYKNVNNNWIKVGSDIDGEAAGDLSGASVSLSADGTIVAIGAYSNDEKGYMTGHVRIFKNVNNSWTQIGSDIDGEAAGDWSAFMEKSVSLSADGTIVAIGAQRNDGNKADGSVIEDSGHVRIYRNINNNWTQIGSDIDGADVFDLSGNSVSLSSNGSIVAIGSWNRSINGPYKGHVRIFQNTNNNWTQIGSDIDGEADGDHSGYSVSLSADGSTVAIGAKYNEGTGERGGHVRIYKNVSGTWTRVGFDIDAEAAGDESGTSVSLSADGSTVAIGAPENNGNGIASGHVRVYEVNNIDITPPNAPSSLSTSSLASDKTPAITGTAEAGSTVKLYNGSTLLGSTTADNNGTF